MSRRDNYIYVVLCGAGRAGSLVAFTDKTMLRKWLGGQTRTDLSVKRFADGEDNTGTIMSIEKILEGK